MLESEKWLEAVSKGIPVGFQLEETKQVLEEKNYLPTKVSRMNGKRGKTSMVLVKIAEGYKSIYNELKSYSGLKIEA